MDAQLLVSQIKALLAAESSDIGKFAAMGAIFGVDSLSLIACCTVLSRVSLLPQSCRARLFPRQVAVLAVADIVYLISRIPWCLGGFSRHPAKGSKFFMYWAYEMTLIAEVSIMFGFAMQSLGWKRGFALFTYLAWAPIVLAAGTAALSMAICSPWQLFSLVEAEATWIALGLSLVAVGVILWQAGKSSSVLERRGRLRAFSFILNFLVTVGPPCVFVTTAPGSEVIRDDGKMSPLQLIGTLCLHSNGLINAATYFYQSRYAGQEQPDFSSTGTPDMQVRFGGVTVEDFVGDPEATVVKVDALRSY